MRYKKRTLQNQMTPFVYTMSPKTLPRRKLSFNFEFKMHRNEGEKGHCGAKSGNVGLLQEKTVSPVPSDHPVSFKSLIKFGIG